MFSEKNLKRLVIFQGVLLVGGLIVVIAAIAYRLSSSGPTPLAPPVATPALALPNEAAEKVAVPEGSRLVGATSDGRVLILHLQTKEGRDRVLVLDLDRGNVLGDYELEPK
jgi:Family of unknown function (DUF6476)